MSINYVVIIIFKATLQSYIDMPVPGTAGHTLLWSVSSHS